MCDNVNNNPFAALFSTINDAVSFSTQSQSILEGESNDIRINPRCKEHDSDPEDLPGESGEDPKLEELRILADVFGIALSNFEPLADTEVKEPLVLVSAESMEHAVFERLMLSDLRLVPPDLKPRMHCDTNTLQDDAIPYLFECFCRLRSYQAAHNSSDIVERARRIIWQNAGTVLQEPELFDSQTIHEDFMVLFQDSNVSKDDLSAFTSGIANKLQANDNGEMHSVIASFGPLLDIVREEAANSRLILREHWFNLLHLFCTIEPLAKLLIIHSTPETRIGQAYADTVLGALFNINCLPKTIDDPYDYFDKQLQQSDSAVERNVWGALDSLSEALYRVFHLLLKCSPEVRRLTLEWIGNCLETNANRGKLWNAHNETISGTSQCVSDGFMLNLGNVLLRLSQPFCIKENEKKFPKIDPTYCAVEATDDKEKNIPGVHLRGMSSETCLIPISDDGTRPVAKSFGFTTECFFMTHRALDLGYRVVLDKLLRTNQDLARIQRMYSDTLVEGNSSVLEIVTFRMEMEMSKYLSLRASLLPPEMLKLLAKFHATTAAWLVQVYLDDAKSNDEERTDYVPRECKDVNFPLPETVPDTLKCIPEFVVENTIRFLCFLRRFSPNTFEVEGLSFLTPVLTEIIVLMESQRRLYNPHLRARLAGALEAVLPTVDVTVTPAVPNFGTFHRGQLFITHPHRGEIVGNLLQVFVSIEMTGQSVQFEQKFNYRRPMYVVMEFLWKLPEHRAKFVLLAEEAEGNMEAVQPPLFLRFINLLMNDAVFLLDEALSNMAQLRQMLQARENGDWNNLPQHERDQQAGYLQHVGMIARFDNILGRKTIQMLRMLTVEIKSIFCHPTMVDRIASMLNYLLLQLVGPNKKNLKVKDQEEYAFNPANLVLNICEIYINLSKSESFTLAVSQDGRSYSPELFKLAENVLVRIGGVGILGNLDQFAKSVEAAANQKKEEDEILIDAPDEFLDPIMSTLMMNPVILPSSRIRIDRQTIARHLLSDQTDPFNRSPLTMDMVKTDVELQRKIQEWIQQKKEEKAALASQERSDNVA